MKTHTKFLAFGLSALLMLSLLSGCEDEGPEPIDESGYLGDYIGFHRLVDSVNFYPVLGTEIDYSFYDTLKVTSGADPTDGLIYALSGYLNGNIIEIDLSKATANITPVNVGTVLIGSTTLKNTKMINGSNVTWNDDKSIAFVKLLATVTVNLGGTDIPISNVRLHGDFIRN
jgi:hypothetical protein